MTYNNGTKSRPGIVYRLHLTQAGNRSNQAVVSLPLGAKIPQVNDLLRIGSQSFIVDKLMPHLLVSRQEAN